MLSLVLALALAQPVSSGGSCGPGKLCRVGTLRVTRGTADFIVGSTAGPGGTTLPGLKFDTGTTSLSICNANNATCLGLNLGSGVVSSPNLTVTGVGTLNSSGVSIGNVSTATALTSPSAIRGFAGATTENKVFLSDTNAWAEVGTGTHPVIDRRTWVTESDAAAGVRWFNAGVPRVRHTLWNLATVGTFVVSPVNAGLLITGQRGGAAVRVEDVPWTTGAVANDRAGYFNAGALVMPHQRRFKICQPVGALSASTSIRIVIGQAASTLFTAPSDNPVNAGAWIRFSSAAGDTNFMLCTSDGVGAATCTSTSVPPSTTAGVGSVVCVDQLEQTAVTAWVDGRPRVRVNTNITTSDATTGSFGAIAQTLTAATRTVSFGAMSLEATP